MYNKEAMRKLLEDCWDEGLAVGWDNARHGHSKRPNRDTYITSQLSAMEQGGGNALKNWQERLEVEVLQEIGDYGLTAGECIIIEKWIETNIIKPLSINKN